VVGGRVIVKKTKGAPAVTQSRSLAQLEPTAVISPRLNAPVLKSGLYLVATPIGNLRDITLRAIDTLGAADRILCEDTRTTKRLLDAHGIKARNLEAFHEHNEDGRQNSVMIALENGETVALVSDAGTPTISDPGFKLVRAVAAAGYAIFAIPGASAAISALICSGLPTDRFLFAGFTPPRSGQRRNWYAELRAVPATLIAYETGPRLAASLADALAVLGDRPAMVARELTKFYEEMQRGSLAALAEHYATVPAPKGEIVLVIAGPSKALEMDVADLDSILRDALASFGVKDAASHVAARTGLPRRDVYSRALELKAGY
jgi:16S rRNA (cytidine1402-2'-O)-methyltransferase